MKKIWVCFGSVLAVAFAANAWAADYTMKIGWAETADPMGHPASAAMHAFKDEVEKESGGRMEVQLYPTGQLGDAKSMLSQVKQGILQSCASIPSGMIAGRYYKNLNMFDIPYLFDDNITAWRVLNPSTRFFHDLSDDLARKTGIRPLAFFVEGQRHFTNNTRPITKVADLKGLKIRTMEVPAHMEMVRAFDASPTPISWLELYSSLQTGVIDGEENPISNILYAKLNEVQKYLTLDGHLTLLDTWVINEKWYAGLPADLRAIVDRAASMAEITNRGLAQVMEVTGIGELAGKGMQITRLSPASLAEFRKVSQARVLPYIEKAVDDATWITRIQAEIKTAQP